MAAGQKNNATSYLTNHLNLHTIHVLIFRHNIPIYFYRTFLFSCSAYWFSLFFLRGAKQGCQNLTPLFVFLSTIFTLTHRIPGLLPSSTQCFWQSQTPHSTHPSIPLNLSPCFMENFHQTGVLQGGEELHLFSFFLYRRSLHLIHAVLIHISILCYVCLNSSDVTIFRKHIPMFVCFFLT